MRIRVVCTIRSDKARLFFIIIIMLSLLCVAFQASPRLREYLEEMSPTPGNARELLSHLLAGHVSDGSSLSSVWFSRGRVEVS